MRVREEIDRLTRLWYWFAGAWALLFLLSEKFNGYGVLYAASILGFGLPAIWVCGKLLLAGSRRARAIAVAMNVGLLGFEAYAIDSLIGNFIRWDHSLHTEGFKLQFFLFALYVTVRTVGLLASGPVRRYFAAR